MREQHFGHNPNPNSGEQNIRVRLPRQGQFVGLIDQRVGGSRMLVKCNDGKVRNCKVLGKLRRALWLREGDYVIVEPWEFDNDKGNIVFKYTPAALRVLEERGFLKGIDEEGI